MKSIFYLFGYLNQPKFEIKSKEKFHFCEKEILCGDSILTIYRSNNGVTINFIDTTKILNLVPTSASLNWTIISFVDNKSDGYVILKDDLLNDKDVSKVPNKWRDLVCFNGSNLIGISSDFDLYYIEIGNEFKLTMEYFPSKLKICAIACGSDHILILSKGRALTKGLGSRGQLGHGDLENLSNFKVVSQLGSIVSRIACGLWHSVILTEAGDVYSWGWNESGQLGVPCFTSKERLKLIFDNLDDLEEYSNMHMEPVMVYFPIRDWSFQKVQCGSRHTICLNEDGKVFAFGFGGMGQLGKEDGLSYDYPVEVDGFKATNIQCTQWGSVLTVDSNSGAIFDQ